jgi:acetyl-CoA carboxylase carboxyl transferase subunit alpha
VIGEGGSGGALALAVADRVLMQENATYSVITPEGCAAILWRDAAYAPQAAEALKPTASHLLQLGVVEKVIEEPRGGAHHNPEAAAASVGAAISEALAELSAIPPEQRRRMRRRRFQGLGDWMDPEQPPGPLALFGGYTTP